MCSPFRVMLVGFHFLLFSLANNFTIFVILASLQSRELANYFSPFNAVFSILSGNIYIIHCTGSSCLYKNNFVLIKNF